jgi:hypothetical protein
VGGGGGVKAAGKDANLATFVSPFSRNPGSPKGPAQACSGIALPFTQVIGRSKIRIFFIFIGKNYADKVRELTPQTIVKVNDSLYLCCIPQM